MAMFPPSATKPERRRRLLSLWKEPYCWIVGHKVDLPDHPGILVNCVRCWHWGVGIDILMKRQKHDRQN